MKYKLKIILCLVISITICFTGVKLITAEASDGFDFYLTDRRSFGLGSYSGDAEDVVIPEALSNGYKVTEIAPYAFSYYNNDHVKTITIPQYVEYIHGSAFTDCNNLEEIIIDKNNPYFVFENGILYNYDKTEMIYNMNLKDTETYVVPKGITKIGDGLFYDCVNLKKVIIPEGVIEIGNEAFRRCHKLSEIVLPNSLRIIGESAFSECYDLKSIRIPYGVTEIPLEAFSASGLESIELQSSINIIGKSAFKSCSLKEIKLPEGLINIEDEAFYGCSSLQKVELPDGLISIGWGAFYDCPLLAEINIPDSVTTIGESAFGGCKSLRSVELSKNLECISSYMFSSCIFLKSIVIPDSVKKIEPNAFKNCYNLVLYSNPNPVIEEYVKYRGIEWKNLEKEKPKPLSDDYISFTSYPENEEITIDINQSYGVVGLGNVIYKGKSKFTKDEASEIVENIIIENHTNGILDIETEVYEEDGYYKIEVRELEGDFSKRASGSYIISYNDDSLTYYVKVVDEENDVATIDWIFSSEDTFTDKKILPTSLSQNDYWGFATFRFNNYKNWSLNALNRDDISIEFGNGIQVFENTFYGNQLFPAEVGLSDINDDTVMLCNAEIYYDPNEIRINAIYVREGDAWLTVNYGEYSQKFLVMVRNRNDNDTCKGDADYNGVVDAADALEVLMYAVKRNKLSVPYLLLADVNEDDVVNANDALEILRVAARLRENEVIPVLKHSDNIL